MSAYLQPKIRQAIVYGIYLFTLSACTGFQIPYSDVQSNSFPLDPCTSPPDESNKNNCIRNLFSGTGQNKSDAIKTRDTKFFPTRYLELWNEDVRKHECELLTSQQNPDCKTQIDNLAEYFNPGNKIPPNDILGVALEGGGSKSAPFSLGVLGGLQEAGFLKEKKVGAIASVSGGSYAAHFLFNRYMDQAEGRNSSNENDWFRSCIPDEFASTKDEGMYELFNLYKASNKLAKYQPCGDLQSNSPYRYQIHVWTHPDILKEFGGADIRPQNSNRFNRDEFINFSGLMGKSILSDFVSIPLRDVFRQPISYSPTRKIYKAGIERQFGYAPEDWEAFYDPQNPFKSPLQGRTLRTLDDIGKLPSDLPKWVIGASTPGWISGTDWLHASATDPVRHQFELSAQGHGSGITGYVKAAPEGPATLNTPYTSSMSVIDAVVTSAAFFDDNQQLFGREPLRFFMALAQTALNLEWFTEIRNFNASDTDRKVQVGVPWPLYLSSTSLVPNSPYIHLQDGGNSEGAALLPILRRGYKKVVWAHGTTDANAEFSSLCHLKNQLEVDGWYFIRSPDLEKVVTELYPEGVPKRFQRGDGSWSPEFQSYFDYLCTMALDDGDLKAIDDNPNIDSNTKAQQFKDNQTPNFKRLFCSRLGLLDESGKEKFEKTSKISRTDCDSLYREKVDIKSFPRINPNFSRWPFLEDLFFRMSGRPLRFMLFSGPRYTYQNGRMPEVGAKGTAVLSIIYALTPSLSWEEVKDHVKIIKTSEKDEPTSTTYETWSDYCKSKKDNHMHWSITACKAPMNIPLKLAKTSQQPSLSCNALTYLLKYEDSCQENYSSTPPSLTPIERPNFPQDNFVKQTLHSGYVKFAAYFDLARQGVWNAKCELEKPWEEAKVRAWFAEPICTAPSPATVQSEPESAHPAVQSTAARRYPPADPATHGR